MNFLDLLPESEYKAQPSDTLTESKSASAFPFFETAPAEEYADEPADVDRMPTVSETVPQDDALSVTFDDQPMAKKPKKSASKAPKKSATKPAPVIPEEVLIAGRWSRAVALRKINEARLLPSMQEKLADLMKLPTPLQLIKKSDDELSEIIEEMELHLASRNGLGEMIKTHVVPKSLEAYEKILTYLGVPAQGVSELLLTNPEFRADIDELVWKRVSYSNWPVEIRLMISLVGVTVSVVTANMKARSFVAEVDLSGLNAQFSDL